MKRIAVVGAGISGLATAWYLQRHGIEVEVFESRSDIGGVIDTLHIPGGSEPSADTGFLIECGADNFATLMPDAWDLVRDMGLESEFITPNKDHRIAQVVYSGKLYPIPNGFSLMQPTRLGAILTTPILSLAGKLRVLRERWIPQRNSDEDESVESFAVRRLGRECFERLVEPIVGGIFTARADTLSMQAAMPQFVRMEKEHGSLIRAAFAKRRKANAESRSAREASGARYDQFVAPKLGMKWWLQKLAEPLGNRLHLDHRVLKLEHLPEGDWLIEFLVPKNENAKGEHAKGTKHFDGICLAMPSYCSASLVSGLDPELGSLLDGIPYASSAIAIFAVRRSEIHTRAICFGSIAPTTENRNCLAISLSSEKYAGRTPSDTVLMRVFMGGAVRPELLLLSDESLLDLARKEVRELFGVTSPPSYERLIRWDRAMPQYLVGHMDRVAKIRARVSKLTGLAIVGNAFDGVGIPQCIRGARLAAKSLNFDPS